MTIATGFIWHSFLKQDPNAVVLCIRSNEESDTTLRFGAIEAPLSDEIGFRHYLHHLDRTKHYYIYSKTGVKGELACELMEDAGFNETINLDGGLNNFRF
jgi:rhodanese-related sulfurtransferase